MFIAILNFEVLMNGKKGIKKGREIKNIYIVAVFFEMALVVTMFTH